MHLLLRYARPAAFLWLLIASVLFCLPGSTIPKAGWLEAIYADKWVHVGIFTLLVLFWGTAFHIHRTRQYLLLLLAALAYGFLVEVVQDKLIANRDFDLWDVACDMVGALLGLGGLVYLKK